MSGRRVTAGALALLLVAAWLAWPAADPPAPSAARPPYSAPAPPPDGPGSAEVVALERLAAATGRYVAVCPDYDGPEAPAYPVPARRFVRAPDGSGFIAMLDDPSGTIEVRKVHVRVVEPGGAEVSGPAEVVAVLRWRTDAAGRTTCVLEPPAAREVQVRIVDADGRPVEGALVLVLTVPFPEPGYVSGPDGWVTIRLYADEGAWVVAGGYDADSGRVWLDPSAGPATVAVSRHRASPGVSAFRSRVREEQASEERAELAALLADPTVPPEVAAVLAGWDAELAGPR